MAEESPGAVALMSIHPRFANAILNGTKQVEFRKVGFKRPVTHALLYATAPVQQIIGFVEITGVDEAPPAALWRRYHLVAGIERDAFFDYYRDRATGFALKVSRPCRLREPLALDELHNVVPQSFLYSTVEALSRVRDLA
jgi:predicted transcriptional regulator